VKKLVIFGVGLIGGSVALALKRAAVAPQIIGIGRSGDGLQAALDMGIIDAVETDPAKALLDADMVIIATPVAQTPDILKAIAPHLNSKTVVTDVGSTKSDVIQHAVAILGENVAQFVPGHPIAGAEKSGVTAARADLFNGKNVILTPAEKTNPEALEQVRQLWQATGAKVSEMAASEHDGVFAAVSHLPHLLAPEMWRDICLTNRESLLSEISAYQNELATLKKLLENSDDAGLQALFERASRARNEWANGQKH